MIYSSAVRVLDRSSVAEVRRASLDHTMRLEWTESARANAAIVATELASNQVKHAKDGVISISSTLGPPSWLLFVAVDRGPGMNDYQQCLEDGYSTRGSPGTGLGAISRLADKLDAYSTPEGTVMVVEMRSPSSHELPRGLSLAGFSVPTHREPVNGDNWDARIEGDSLTVLVCDGLGHGHFASLASRQAVTTFSATEWDSPKEALALIDEALRPTRGAAAAIATIDSTRSIVRYCGVGNIAAAIVSGSRTRHLVSQNGILGHTGTRMTEFEYPWSTDSVLVLHSDGITARWRAEQWPSLWYRHPGIIAGVLYRDCMRGNDDAVAVAVTSG